MALQTTQQWPPWKPQNLHTEFTTASISNLNTYSIKLVFWWISTLFLFNSTHKLVNLAHWWSKVFWCPEWVTTMAHNRNYEHKKINYLLDFLLIGSIFRMWWAQKIRFFYLKHSLAASWNPHCHSSAFAMHSGTYLTLLSYLVQNFDWDTNLTWLWCS